MREAMMTRMRRFAFSTMAAEYEAFPTVVILLYAQPGLFPAGTSAPHVLVEKRATFL